jgi:hypothetical protein
MALFYILKKEEEEIINYGRFHFEVALTDGAVVKCQGSLQFSNDQLNEICSFFPLGFLLELLLRLHLPIARNEYSDSRRSEYHEGVRRGEVSPWYEDYINPTPLVMK